MTARRMKRTLKRVVVPLNLKVKDADAPASVNVQLIVVGVAAT